MDDDAEKDEQRSEGEGEAGEGDAGSRKKNGQRFFSTGYPPCNHSFARSAHLARHIRKHTGEWSFQWQRNLRFSQLDNLRQHAQSVRAKEEIPTDSLADTETCFQLHTQQYGSSTSNQTPSKDMITYTRILRILPAATRLTVIGNSKAMSYGDIVEAQRTRGTKDAGRIRKPNGAILV
ncbi:Up in starvation [Exophiala xenobiotica]|uniref:Up in starvation n=1 Tax=Vermiconidia calcicola TaxID=1690605 RepID=A0AAV9PQ95_9PEZI|nr:Up in starvation [Exophiala xenobiotica]KAK5527584.1 Up in starvation [Vermiconidia calcicola]KAK5529002.1 Up in starvation [Chaetothyriales sp. CCFEE 6169]KAK5231828.1 Up in starvation [Exophiala xenobiotica]KAK5243819.1 Up in starvation [Exophiala xenobiotica]